MLSNLKQKIIFQGQKRADLGSSIEDSCLGLDVWLNEEMSAMLRTGHFHVSPCDSLPVVYASADEHEYSFV